MTNVHFRNIYKEVQNIELIYSESQVVEFIVTDKDLARHHFPKEHYYYDLYKEQLVHIDSFDFNEIKKEYGDYIERLLKSDSPCVVTPRERALLEVTLMDKNNISRDHLKNNQLPFFNGYRPQFYFKPNGKVEKLSKFPKYTNNQKGETK